LPFRDELSFKKQLPELGQYFLLFVGRFFPYFTNFLIEDYIYSVPYVEDNEKIFLKTMIPDNKVTRRYFMGKK